MRIMLEVKCGDDFLKMWEIPLKGIRKGLKNFGLSVY